MTGFLNRLAGFATGSPAPGAARIALPPRFAPSPMGPIQPHDLPPADSIAVMTAAFEPHTESRWEHETRREPAPIVAVAQRDRRQAEASETAIASDTPILHRTNRRSIEESPALAMASASAPTAELRVAKEAPPNTPAVPRLAPLLDVAMRQQSPAHAAVATSAPQPHNIRAPLHADVLASRAAAPRNDPPVYVTIDRIDVRVAPAAKPAATPARERRAASLSLSDYLRGGERGGRP